MSELKCVVVTPEKTELDVSTDAVTIPLFDGEMGIRPGHSPLVGRLGYGFLRIGLSGSSMQYFIEGGLVQVQGDVVSVLTDRLVAAEEITSTSAAEAMKDALAIPTDQPELSASREKAIARARAMSRLAG